VTGALSCLTGGLTDSDVTSLLTSLLPVRRQHRRQSVWVSRPVTSCSQSARSSTAHLPPTTIGPSLVDIASSVCAVVEVLVDCCLLYIALDDTVD